MLRPVSRWILRKAQQRPCNITLRVQCRLSYSTKQSGPLRILFCGSDEFSIASLKALHDEHQRDPGLIESIDVVCRPGKRTGRGLKTIREVPVKAVAQNLGLPIHEIDTFKGWSFPEDRPPVNLIIAVSFGLFIPVRIIRAAEYRGLNVHPSILPQFRGPAPLQHTLLSGQERTGVTLQTLDEKSFDHGVILAQTPGEGLPLPHGSSTNYEQLLEYASNLGADILVQGLRDRVYVPPLKALTSGIQEDTDLIHASKVTAKDSQMPWEDNQFELALRRERAFGRLWTELWSLKSPLLHRCILEGIEAIPAQEIPVIADIMSHPEHIRSQTSTMTVTTDFGSQKKLQSTPIYFTVVSTGTEAEKAAILYLPQDDGSAIFLLSGYGLKVKNITTDGQPKCSAKKAMKKIRDGAKHSSIDWNIKHEPKLYVDNKFDGLFALELSSSTEELNQST